MPTIDIPDKICPHCGGTRWTVTVLKSNGYVSHVCFYRLAENRKKWRATEKGKELTLMYAKTDSRKRILEKYNAKQSSKDLKAKLARNKYHRDKLNDPEKLKACKNKTYNKSVIKLADWIIRKYLVQYETCLKVSDIPQWLTELKRKELLLTRQIKNKKNGKDN